MKKRVTKTLLGKKGERKSRSRGQLKSMFRYGKITVSNSVAKQLARLVDRLTARTKGRDRLNATRYLITQVADLALAKQILTYSQLVLSKRQSGFTTQTKLNPRRGDAHEETIIELIDFIAKPKVKKTAKTKATPEPKKEPEPKVLSKK